MDKALSIPQSPADVTPEWLTDALRSSGVLTTGRVSAASCESLGAGAGFIGQLARVRLTYEGDAGNAPSTLIAKMPALDEGAKALGSMYGLYEREYRFYRELAPQIAFRTPRCYYADGDVENVNYILLLEDLGASGKAGDQVAGCSPEEAHLALTQLATHHAHWWNNPKLDEMTWIQPGIDLVNGAMEQAYPLCWEPTLAIFGDRIPQQIRDVLPGLAPRITALMAPYGEGPLTLAHGDYRLDNMFFGNAGADYELAVLDWQSPNRGWGLYDVAYFMYANLDIETRRACEMDVLREYHNTLGEGGVTGYTLDQCIEDYAKSLVISLAIWVVNGASLDTANDRGKALFDMWFDRLSAAILDHDALSHLPA